MGASASRRWETLQLSDYRETPFSVKGAHAGTLIPGTNRMEYCSGRVLHALGLKRKSSLFEEEPHCGHAMSIE